MAKTRQLRRRRGGSQGRPAPGRGVRPCASATYQELTLPSTMRLFWIRRFDRLSRSRRSACNCKNGARWHSREGAPRVEQLRENFDADGESRPGAREVARSIHGVNATLPHGRQILTASGEPHPSEFRHNLLEAIAAWHQHNDLRLRG